MTIWNPAKVFIANPQLRLNDSEINKIQRNLPAVNIGADQTPQYYADAVFEGGGVKGTAFLGALRCFDDVGIQFRKVAGTSAGAITAAMVAAGFDIEQLERDIIGPLDYEGTILSQKTSWLIRNGSPSDDLANFQWLLARLVAARQDGQYSSEPFVQWLSSHLQDRLPTFALFSASRQAGLPWHEARDLRVVISDISRQEMCVLPEDLPLYDEAPEQFSVAEAVRLSMSIPLFFKPGQLKDSTIVDGGILSNFPLWIYDAKPGQEPKCPTFGFRLMEKGVKPSVPVKGAFGILRAMVETMQVARDSHHTRGNDLGRVIDIPTGNISATKFDLTQADKDQLYQAGYAATKAFLLDWSWEEHLRQRGFGAAALNR